MHYHRLDFTEGQARSVIADMLGDLMEYAVVDIETAAEEYRRDPKSQFFPKPGQLRALAGVAAKARSVRANVKALPTDVRPSLWWMQSKAVWKSHWKEHEVPAGEMIRDTPSGKLRVPTGREPERFQEEKPF